MVLVRADSEQILEAPDQEASPSISADLISTISPPAQAEKAVEAAVVYMTSSPAFLETGEVLELQRSQNRGPISNIKSMWVSGMPFEAPYCAWKSLVRTP